MLAILEFVLSLLVETLFFYTGEFVLYILAFGRKKIRWDFYTSERPAKYVLLSEMSVWVGFFFWIFTIGWMVRLFFM